MMKKMHLLTALVSGLSMVPYALLASGCDGLPWKACTDIGCYDEVGIQLRGLEAGQAYEVTVESMDESVHCAIDTSEGLRMRCGNEVLYSDFQDEVRISFKGTPESLTITVRQDGTVIAQDAVMPAYQEFEPNGPGCGPICLNDQILVDLRAAG